MEKFKFSTDDIVDTPGGRGRIFERDASFPHYTYRAVMENIKPVRTLTFNENELVAAKKND